ncbi:MAG: XrtA-associated tyrosine autokinase [Pseudomonadota bacterium]
MSSIEKAIERLSKEREKASNTAQVDGVMADATVQHENPGFTAVKEFDGKTDILSDSLKQEELDEVNYSAPIKNREQVNSDDIEYKLNLKELTKAGYLTPESNNKILSEEYRAIKRPILMNAFGKGAAPIERGNLITITSSLPGEGKTYTSLNLALSIATELDSTILIIDGDILNPQLSRFLGLEKKRGLTDVLHDSHTGIRDVMIGTQIPKLKIIPAGNKYENSTELLASDAMEKLVIELGDRYSDRIVLFDSPPLLATSEAAVLNHLMGQILLVVEAGKTPVDAVKESLSHINDEKVIGLVLNKTNGHAGRSGYGSYGGYG